MIKTEELKMRKILIADDDEDSRLMLSLILEEEGWEVSEACDGKEALEKVIQYQPDVLILDNRMPKLTGIEVYQKLRDQGVKLGVVFATAYGGVSELANSLNIAHFVSKPFDIPELLACIESAYQDLHAESTLPKN
jgi:two-component system response regulator (stage 0 sporulation protein F)